MFRHHTFLLIALSVSVASIIWGCGRDSGVPVVTAPTSEIDRIKTAAADGVVESQLALGRRYEKGDGVVEDQTQAFQWFLAAAKAGNTDASVIVAERYEEGVGVQQSWDEASQWWRRAADAGNAMAQYKVAKDYGALSRNVVYVFGEGRVEQEPKAKEFIAWLTKSSNNGHLPARHVLAMTYLLGAREDVTGFYGAQAYVIAPDPDRGVKLLTEAAEGKHWESQWALAILYQAGFGKIRPDNERSTKWWDMLSQQADANVQWEIGERYEARDKKWYRGGNKWRGKNLTFEATNKVAAEWFEKAEKQGNKRAAFGLGRL